jgi:hypothetical protein
LGITVDQADLAHVAAGEPDTCRFQGCEHGLNLSRLSAAPSGLEHHDRTSHDTRFPREFVLRPVQEHARRTKVPRTKKLQILACFGRNVHYSRQSESSIGRN